MTEETPEEEHFEIDPNDARPVMIGLPSGVTIIGILIDEDENSLDIAMPLSLHTVRAKIGDIIAPCLMFNRYATGVYRDFITLNKYAIMFMNDVDESIDRSYYETVQNIYPECSVQHEDDEDEKQEEFYPEFEQKMMEEEEDRETDKIVTQDSIRNRGESLQHLIERLTKS